MQSGSDCNIEDFMQSLEQLAMSSAHLANKAGVDENIVKVAQTFQAILDRGHRRDLSDQADQLSSCTNSYCTLVRQLDGSGCLPLDSSNFAIVMRPLHSLCHLAAEDTVSGNVFCSAVAVLVEVACRPAHHPTPLMLSSTVEVIAPCLPTARLKFSSMETAAAAAAALADLCTTSAAAMPVLQAQQCFSHATQSLHGLATSSPPADDWHTKVLSHVLTALSSLAPLQSLQLRESVAKLVDASTLLWTLGLPASVSKPPSTSRAPASQPSLPGSPTTDKYIPPWRRNSHRSSSDAADTSPYSSDTSMSSRKDTDTGLRVRVAALKLLTLLLQSHPTALHPVWDRLIPNSNATLPSARPRSLLGVLLHDPCATARTAAAVAVQTMLTGPRNAAFIRVARSASAGPQRRARLAPARSFMPLSESLALMVQAMHTCLAAALQREAVPEVIVEALKAADTLMQHAPYENLPAELPQDLVNACAVSWNGVDSRTGAQVLLSLLHMPSAS